MNHNECENNTIYNIISELKKNKDKIRIMHVCGTHERTISKYGIRKILPSTIEVISGPGCPVCVTPVEDIDAIIILAKKGFTIITYGDMLRVPGTVESLFSSRSNDINIKMVYSIDDAVKIAIKNSKQKYIFFAIGFETTIPTVANVIKKGLPHNLSIFTSLKLTIPAMKYLINKSSVDAFIAPGHVATIIGTKPFEIFKSLNSPVVISGFEMIDILKSIYLLSIQINNKVNNINKINIENEYKRVVTENGNEIAKRYINEVFDITDANWRGIGVIKNSGLVFKKEYEEFDAKKKYKYLYEEELINLKYTTKYNNINKKCICSKIITGKDIPSNCTLFMKFCTPSNPIGACMVSDEGTCFNWYKYRNR